MTSAATAVGSGDKAAPRKPKILRAQPYRNPARTIYGFFSAELPSGLIVHDLKLMRGPAGAFWIGCPDQKQRDREDQVRVGQDGKPLWHPIIEFRDRKVREKFNELLLAALREANPELFDEEGPA